MKLSIITINFNNLSGLRKTMESVFEQTYQDFEYIVIDGASTDGSAEYVRNNADKLTYCVSEQDTGIYNAMNKGISAAKGDYLLFLNSGDFLIQKDVLDLVFATNPQNDIVCAGCNVSDNGRVVWTSIPPSTVTLSTLYFQGLAHQSTFIRKTLFDKYGLYREDFRYNSDIDFWYKSIILGEASTETCDVIITDYNLDGISTKETNTIQYTKEMTEILSHPYLQRCLPDYESWKSEQPIVEEYGWINHHSFLRKMLRIDYKIRKKLHIL